MKKRKFDRNVINYSFNRTIEYNALNAGTVSKIGLSNYFGSSLNDNDFFTNFQNVKVIKIKIIFTPIIKDGNNPPPLMGVYATDRVIATIPENNRYKIIKPDRTSIITWRQRGVGDGYNQWVDCSNFNSALGTLVLQSPVTDVDTTAYGSYMIKFILFVKLRYIVNKYDSNMVLLNKKNGIENYVFNSGNSLLMTKENNLEILNNKKFKNLIMAIANNLNYEREIKDDISECSEISTIQKKTKLQEDFERAEEEEKKKKKKKKKKVIKKFENLDCDSSIVEEYKPNKKELALAIKRVNDFILENKNKNDKRFKLQNINPMTNYMTAFENKNDYQEEEEGDEGPYEEEFGQYYKQLSDLCPYLNRIDRRNKEGEYLNLNDKK